MQLLQFAFDKFNFRLLWLALIGVTLYFCTIISLESWDRYLTKSTVVAIEKDYYYWNTSLPSLTACPAERIDKTLFDNYCRYWILFRVEA